MVVRSNVTQQAKKAAFLAAYARQGNISGAAKAAGIDRVTHYRWLVDPVYAQAFQEAGEDAIDSLEAVARERAFAGSDVLLIFLLKAARPARYRERVDVVLDVRKEIEKLTSDPDERAAAILEAEAILAAAKA